MELVALISTGKGSWNEVSDIIEKGDWEKIILVGNEFGRKFTPKKQADFVSVNLDADIETLKSEMMLKLKNKLSGMEVALSIASGTGKEHSALISTLISIPVGVKFVASAQNKIIEF